MEPRYSGTSIYHVLFIWHLHHPEQDRPSKFIFKTFNYITFIFQNFDYLHFIFNISDHINLYTFILNCTPTPVGAAIGVRSEIPLRWLSRHDFIYIIHHSALHLALCDLDHLQQHGLLPGHHLVHPKQFHRHLLLQLHLHQTFQYMIMIKSFNLVFIVSLYII